MNSDGFMGRGKVKVYTAEQRYDLLERLLQAARGRDDLDHALPFYRLAIGIASNISLRTGFAERITEEAVDKALEESAMRSGFLRNVKEDPGKAEQAPQPHTMLPAQQGNGRKAMSGETKNISESTRKAWSPRKA